MNEEQIKQALKDKGWAKHVYEGGSDYLLNQWKKVVEDVEQGCHANYMPEEYWNDMDTRLAIRDANLDSKVEDLDERFKNALIRTDVQLWGNEKDSDKFWYYGYPKKAKGTFLENIHRLLEKYDN